MYNKINELGFDPEKMYQDFDSLFNYYFFKKLIMEQCGIIPLTLTVYGEATPERGAYFQASGYTIQKGGDFTS